MIDKDFFTTDELEQMLRPQCEFHASDDLRERIVKQVSSVHKFNYKRFIFRAAAAAAIIAAVVTVVFADYGNKPDAGVESLTAQAVGVNDDTVAASRRESAQLAELPPSGVPTTKEPTLAEVHKKSEVRVASVEKRKKSATKPHAESDTYAMTAGDNYNIHSMTPSAEEVIRRQYEADLDYIAYVQQEIAMYEEFLNDQLNK